DAEVQLALDLTALLDEQLANHAARRAGLMRHQGLAQQASGEGARFLGSLAYLDASGLTSPAGVDLRLHDAHTAEIAPRRCRFVGSAGHFGVQHGDTVPPQDFLRLVLVNIHAALFSESRQRMEGE